MSGGVASLLFHIYIDSREEIISGIEMETSILDVQNNAILQVIEGPGNMMMGSREI